MACAFAQAESELGEKSDVRRTRQCPSSNVLDQAEDCSEMCFVAHSLSATISPPTDQRSRGPPYTTRDVGLHPLPPSPPGLWGSEPISGAWSALGNRQISASTKVAGLEKNPSKGRAWGVIKSEQDASTSTESHPGSRQCSPSTKDSSSSEHERVFKFEVTDRAANFFTKTSMCEFYLKGACKKGAYCRFAHGEGELRQKPDLRCTQMCPVMMRFGECCDSRCRFAHTESDLRQPPLEHLGPQPPQPSRCEGVSSLSAIPMMLPGPLFHEGGSEPTLSLQSSKHVVKLSEELGRVADNIPNNVNIQLDESDARQGGQPNCDEGAGAQPNCDDGALPNQTTENDINEMPAAVDITLSDVQQFLVSFHEENEERYNTQRRATLSTMLFLGNLCDGR